MILDRRLDKNADIGQFELAFKQPQVHVPQYIGMNLSVDGNQIKKPNWMKPKQPESQSMARLSRVLSKTDTGLGSTAKVTATKQDGVKSEKHFSKAEGISCNKTVHATPSDTAAHTVAKNHATLSLTHKQPDAKPGGQIKNNLPTQRMSKSPTRQRSATESRPSRIHRDLSKSVEHKHKRTRHKRHSSLPATANGSANSQHERGEVNTNPETTCPGQHGVNPGAPTVNPGPVGVNPSPCNTDNTQASVSEIVLSTNTNCDVNIGESAHGDVTSTSTQTRLKGNIPQTVKTLPFLSSSSLLTNRNHSVCHPGVTQSATHPNNNQPRTTKYGLKTPPKKFTKSQKLKVPNFVLPVGIQLPPVIQNATLSTSPRTQALNANLMYKFANLKNGMYKSDLRPKIKLRYNHGLTTAEAEQINEQVQKITSIITSGTSIK